MAANAFPITTKVSNINFKGVTDMPQCVTLELGAMDLSKILTMTHIPHSQSKAKENVLVSI